MPAIEIKKLCKTFQGKRKARIQALKNLDLAVFDNEIFGFIGPNGAGKSTTIKILTGQIRPSSGDALIRGELVTNPMTRKRIGYLPENPSFYPFVTAREYLRFVGQVFKMSSGEVRAQTDRVLALLDLSKAADRLIKGFSKGMTQRLGLAQAMLHDPDLYILDEPMSGLDPLGRALVKDIILSLKQQGKTVFFSTHILSDVETVCDRAGIIINGTLTTLEDVNNGIVSGDQSYTLQIRTSNGDKNSLVVEQSSLNAIILQTVAEGSIIERLEPLHKNLEKIFLDTVAISTDHDH